ncbi:MAG: type II toxin-antitoxin system HicB family antitoxin [Chloroflexi bacterium]|nr:type II toxin-antitoxin system HicB family antitoxin [Chloroflexota bacterium]
MGSYYQAEIRITKQEDGLWRLYVPEMKGAWVDARTLEEGFSDIQEAIALMITYYQERGWPLPGSVEPKEGPPAAAILPVNLEEYQFTSPPAKPRASKKS